MAQVVFSRNTTCEARAAQAVFLGERSRCEARVHRSPQWTAGRQDNSLTMRLEWLARAAFVCGSVVILRFSLLAGTFQACHMPLEIRFLFPYNVPTLEGLQRGVTNSNWESERI
jgi:hypothetical protein